VSETLLRDTARALLEVDKVLAPRRRRPVMTFEVRAIAEMYANNEISISEMVSRLDRPRRTICSILRTLRLAQRRRPPNRRERAYARRRDKVVEAILAGDSLDSVKRRWDISDDVLYQILNGYRVRTGMKREVWKASFLS
jgi:hypothetical protein